MDIQTVPDMSGMFEMVKIVFMLGFTFMFIQFVAIVLSTNGK